MQRIITLSIAAVLIVGIGVLVYLETQGGNTVASETGNDRTGTVENPATTTHTSTNTNTNITTATPTGTSGIARQEVAQHASRSSCWSIINGDVYDLTSWIPNHPGGEAAILQLCGTDGSAKFNGAHGGSSRQLTVLAGFKIGALAQ